MPSSKSAVKRSASSSVARAGPKPGVGPVRRPRARAARRCRRRDRCGARRARGPRGRARGSAPRSGGARRRRPRGARPRGSATRAMNTVAMSSCSATTRRCAAQGGADPLDDRPLVGHAVERQRGTPPRPRARPPRAGRPSPRCASRASPSARRAPRRGRPPRCRGSPSRRRAWRRRGLAPTCARRYHHPNDRSVPEVRMAAVEIPGDEQAFLAYVQGGGQVEATDWLPEDYRAKLDQVHRDARQLRAHGRPARARVDPPRADAPAQARADGEGAGRGRPRAAHLPRRRGPRQAARAVPRRPDRRASRSSTTSSTTRRRRGATSASSRGSSTRRRSSARRRSSSARTRRTRGS